MQKILILALALVVVAGCKKAKNTESGGGGGVALAPPGPGGAVHGVRVAAVRTITMHELDQLKTLIEAAYGEKTRMPTAQEMTASLQKDAPNIYKLIESKAIVLTGTSKHENIWAYTGQPHSVAGEHLYISASAGGRISKAELDQRLKQEGQ